MRVQVNGEPRELADESSVSDLIEALALRAELVAVERNGELVRRADHAETRLVEGDVVEVVTLVGGG